MSVPQMHENEIAIDAGLAMRLIAAQFPQWSALALSVAVIALPYYVETNPAITETARHMIREVLADAAGGGRS